MKKWLALIFLAISIPVIAEIKILAFTGSTSEEAYNKKLIKEAVEIASKKGAIVTLIDLRDFAIPMFEVDLEIKYGMPESVKYFRKLMIESNAVIIATPDYNGSIPAILKNALDWASRSEDGKPSREAFRGKKFAIMGATLSGLERIRCLSHLRIVIETIGGEVIPLQVTIPNAQQAFNINGELVKLSQKRELEKEINLLLSSLNFLY